MTAPRRLIAISLAVVVVLSLAGGIYLRIRGSDETDSGGSSVATVPEGGAEQVSSAQSFSTSVAIPVEGAMVLRDTLVISVSAAAQAAAEKEAKLLAQVQGPITRVRVRENQVVRAGQVLLEVDSTEYALRVASAEARVAQARASYREQTLFDDQIEDPEVRAERDRVARAKSGLDEAEVALKQALLELERTQVRAPFGGRVANLMVVTGQWVSPQNELLTIVDLDPIKVEVRVLEAEVGLLAPGRGASISFAAFPGETFIGRIATINPMVAQDTRTARVTVTIANRDGRILPGMYARVSLEARKFPNRVLVPRSAILERDKRTMLFVFEGENNIGLAKWRYVTAGLANDSLVEILPNPETDMVEPGEWVLTDGHYTLIHDAHVRLVESVRAAGGRPQ
ncbi:MAG: efflux RND transporter periplasmic adaptor subunit [Gemmatimonadales bacterium]|nr:efflux RND transporter periplasmic adaptor subunit [Gemmatimonadales bacterium]NIN10246.1 efflux RND transporter periplasmic adaptor subunit [Gemmatimonadales bacterium]NIN49042.1 efflux RND transporter periplasmic adaptor subunit [Gemmatimonadales bacterium]NIP06506.1 efflux RND transporter periplasmic adaptor subunit [Gemmatimonadales bacterium]NIQ98849.1 efflux RND transporter periplasmic adaptor subunit [Gemmatimonadales bacterium]